MAAREREQGIRHPDSPRPAVVDSLRGIPSLYEALRPGYITDAVAPLTQPGILWKLDHSVRVSLSMLDIHAYLVHQNTAWLMPGQDWFMMPWGRQRR